MEDRTVGACVRSYLIYASDQPEKIGSEGANDSFVVGSLFKCVGRP